MVDETKVEAQAVAQAAAEAPAKVAEVIADTVETVTKESAKVAKRTRATAHQTGQNRATRLRQLQGAFTASPAVKGKHVVLVDDVFTTGSTATACAKALLKAGAKQVDVLVLAYVEP